MKIAAIRIRGEVCKSPDVHATMESLKLLHKNHCVLLEDTPVVKGMLRAVSGFITWGEIDDATLKKLVEKRGSESNKTHLRLSPPRGGFDRGGIRMYIKARGACGYRGKGINKLIARMV